MQILLYIIVVAIRVYSRMHRCSHPSFAATRSSRTKSSTRPLRTNARSVRHGHALRTSRLEPVLQHVRPCQSLEQSARLRHESSHGLSPTRHEPLPTGPWLWIPTWSHARCTAQHPHSQHRASSHCCHPEPRHSCCRATDTHPCSWCHQARDQCRED